jgi:hypothetical protein
MFRSVAGISATGPGYSHITIRPQISIDAGPASIKAVVNTMHGPIEVQWNRSIDAKSVDLFLTLPKDASVRFPLLGQRASGVVITDEQRDNNVLFWDRGHFIPGIVGVQKATVINEPHVLLRQTDWNYAEAVLLQLSSGSYRLKMKVATTEGLA